MGRITTNGRTDARGTGAAELRPALDVGHRGRCRALLRELLLDATCAQLLEQPWERISMLEVANLAGVHRSSLYNEFGTRRNLGRALIGREAVRFPATLAQELRLNANTPALALELTFESFLRATRENGLIAALLRPQESRASRAGSHAARGDARGVSRMRSPRPGRSWAHASASRSPSGCSASR